MARAQKFLGYVLKTPKKHDFFNFQARAVRAEMRAPNVFLDLDSPNNEDVFCTLNDKIISKIDN